MQWLRTALVIGLVAAASACGGDDDTSSATTSPPTPATTEPAAPTTGGTPETTRPPTTNAPVTTAAPATTAAGATTAPPTTAPAETTTPPATTAPETTVAATTEPPGAPVSVRTYLLSGERLVTVDREVDGPEVLRGALTALLAGPTAEEAAEGFVTAIPEGTMLRDVKLADGLATVDMSGEFEQGGGSLSMLARVGQVVFTATQFDNVDAVRFWLDGAPIEYLGGEGLTMSDPWTRMMVPRGISGAVIIWSPEPGDTVTSPFSVTGEGDVYEADFPIEIRRDGEVLQTIAPVRAGAWGDWDEFEVSIDVDAPAGPIELVAYDEGGCGDEPECPELILTIVPLTLSD